MALGLLLLPLAAQGASDPCAGDAGPDWRDGPAGYLLTPEERERYGKLRTEEARRAFVSRFWKRLDPDPDDPENAFRDRFEGLCALANERFRAPFVEGWRTDRGRVLVLLGEPDAIRRAPGDPASIAREIWTYQHRPGGRPEPLEIVFYGDRQGQFRIQPRSGADTEWFRDPVEGWRELLKARAALVPQSPGRTTIPRDLARLSEQVRQTTGARSSAVGRRPGQASPAGRSYRPNGGGKAGAGGPLDSPIVFDAAYFFQASDGAIAALLVLEYRATAPADTPAGPASPGCPLAAAWILGAGGRIPRTPPPETIVRLDHRPDIDRPGTVVFTGRAHLEPGDYEVRYAVEDRASGFLAIRNAPLAVPDIPVGELAASTVVPAERFGPLPEGTRSPFAVGSEEVLPRPGASFGRGEPLKIYFQVYGAARDPSSREPRMDVTFRFERAGSHGFKRHGPPTEIRGAAGESMGLTLPVDHWPRGEYRVEILLLDLVSGARASTEGRFRIAD